MYYETCEGVREVVKYKFERSSVGDGAVIFHMVYSQARVNCFHVHLDRDNGSETGVFVHVTIVEEINKPRRVFTGIRRYPWYAVQPSKSRCKIFESVP